MFGVLFLIKGIEIPQRIMGTDNLKKLFSSNPEGNVQFVELIVSESGWQAKAVPNSIGAIPCSESSASAVSGHVARELNDWE